MARKLLIRFLGLCFTVAVSGLATTAVSAEVPRQAPVGSTAAAPVFSVSGPELDVEPIVNTDDSLPFSASRMAAETVAEPENGRGIVRSILLSGFGDTQLADFLFRRHAIIYLLLGAGLLAIGMLYQYGGRGVIELPAPTLALSTGHTLPIVGEAHPLGRMSVRMSERAAVIAVLFHILIFGAWMVGRDLPYSAAARPELHNIFRLMPVPPPIRLTGPPQVVIAEDPVRKVVDGVPDPVPDPLAPDVELASPGELLGLNNAGPAGFGTGGEVEIQPSPREVPTEFQTQITCPIDMGEVPIPLNMPRPVYPEIARTAEIEGVVMLQILVGEDGKVKDVRVTRGHPMLNDAAIAAARRATFTPAMQQKRPVSVWVELPVHFTLY